MTFEEAIQKSFTVPWKIETCISGESCWCRLISPVDPINYTHVYSDGREVKNQLDEIVSAAALNKETAEYIVKIHNKSLEANNV